MPNLEKVANLFKVLVAGEQLKVERAAGSFENFYKHAVPNGTESVLGSRRSGIPSTNVEERIPLLQLRCPHTSADVY